MLEFGKVEWNFVGIFSETKLWKCSCGILFQKKGLSLALEHLLIGCRNVALGTLGLSLV